MIRTRVRSIGAACVFAALATASGVRTAHAESNAAIAEKLFLDGRALMAAGKVHEACEKFADSQRADPAVGTLLHLAACHARDHRPATAWSEFTDAAEQARNAGSRDRERYARAQVAELEKHLQKIVIDVAPPVPGIAITLDAQPLPAGVVGTEIPLDPGDHDLEVNAPGKRPWKRSGLNLATSTAVTHIAVTLEDPPAPATPVLAEPSSAPMVANAGASTDEAPRASPAARRIAGVGAMTAGVGLLVVAAIYEGTSISRSDDVSKYPAGATSQRAEVTDQSSKARTYAIAFGAGGLAAAGVGIFLVVTAHSSSSSPSSTASSSVRARTGVSAFRAAPYAGPHEGGLAFEGAF